MFRIGQDCLCRRDSPRIGKLICPLCWRCSAMAVGLLAALAVVPQMFSTLSTGDQVLAVAACWLPTLADVFAQNASRHAYRSNRWIRVVTGIALGVGILPAGALVKAAVWWS